MRRKSTRLAVTLAACCGAPALADVSYTVEAGVGQSDNVTRVETGEVEESIGTAGLRLMIDTASPRLTSLVNVDADYRHYFDGSYDDEIVGTGDATLNFNLVPGRFTWLVQDSFGQALSDPFAPVTPETRENVNYFTTGPTFSMRLGDAAAVDLFGLYSNSQYERSPFDSSRVMGGLTLSREGRQAGGLSLSLVTDSVEFDDQVGADFKRDSVFLGYSITGARTEIDLEAGYTWLRPDAGTESDAPRLRIDVTREVSASSTLALSLGTQLTDSSEMLRSATEFGSPAPGSGSAGVTSASDPFENTFASLDWRFARNRTAFSLGAHYTEDSFETQTLLDRSNITWRASAERQLGARWIASLNAAWMDEEFDVAGVSAESRELGAALSWQAGRSLGLRLSAERFERETDEGTGEFQENRIFLSLEYRGQETRNAPGPAPRRTRRGGATQ